MTEKVKYQQMLEQEAALWGRVAEAQAANLPPEWRHHRLLLHNVIMHAADIDALLERVQPGMRTLELGCGSGWLTLALAQHGADAHGLDISDTAIEIARNYYAKIRDSVSGHATYEVADLNMVELPDNQYDIVVAKGVLHHLLNLEQVIERIYRSLKPGGWLWVHDSCGDEAGLSVLVASGLMFILPTQVSYRDKFAGLLRFGVRAPSRVKASIQAEGLSPFEGVGRDHDWLALIADRFEIEQRIDSPAVTGYITAQLKLPNPLAIPLLKVIRAVDNVLVRTSILHNTGITVYARKADQ
jgi:2-polyprenyl-3-methyl-5-hydroxy-6-metoxy-1,4-benzoquinol methylase